MNTHVEQDVQDLDSDLTDIARAAIHSFKSREDCLARYDRFESYRLGKAGLPDVPEGSSEEIEEIARISSLNMVGVVVGTFERGLAAVGYRSPDAEDDEPAWSLWQTQGLDAGQAEVHRAVLTYGTAFVSILPGDDGPRILTWSPRDVEAVYEDPRRDDFPLSVTLWREVEGGWSALVIDDENVTVVTTDARGEVATEGESWPHGATFRGRPVCPVVRFRNEAPADDCEPRGEVEPLIRPQRALNSVNFDRIVASRFSVFNQKVIIGWAASKEQILRAGASRTWTFEDHPQDVSVQSLPASPIAPYNELIREMKEDVALRASIPIYQATGSVANVSENTVAMVDSAYQGKLRAKQDILGESWEQVLHVAVVMGGGEAPSDSAEMVWRDTRPRSMGAVVDGISKLEAAGAMLEDLIDILPDISQQKADAIRAGIRRKRGSQGLEALVAAGQAATPAATGVTDGVSS